MSVAQMQKKRRSITEQAHKQQSIRDFQNFLDAKEGGDAPRAPKAPKAAPKTLLDEDGDGKTSFLEAKHVLRGVDTDGDGKISWSEYLKARKTGLLTGDSNSHEMFLARMAKIKEIIIYMVFMVFFSMSSCRDLNNANVFYFGTPCLVLSNPIRVTSPHSLCHRQKPAGPVHKRGVPSRAQSCFQQGLQ
jgi:hypothetical protein